MTTHVHERASPGRCAEDTRVRPTATTHLVVALVVGEIVAFDLTIPAQVFGRQPERYEFAVCGPVPGATAEEGFAVLVPHGLEVLAAADTVMVPGVGRGAWPLPDEALAALRAAADRGARVASICTGALVLAAAGLLDGRRATTHWAYAEHLARLHPAVDVDPRVLYVDDGNVLTSAGGAAGIDLCLHIVAADHGVAVASAVAQRMVVAPQRDPSHAQFLERPQMPADQRGLAATRAWIEERFADRMTVDDMARHAGYSPRSFARLFRAETGTTPLQWLIHLRVTEARRLLETTDLSIGEVATRAGFGGTVALRHHFARLVGTQPSAYRRAFRAR